MPAFEIPPLAVPAHPVAAAQAVAPIDRERFDYIVVGAGAAGSIVAAKAAAAGCKVLLVDVGAGVPACNEDAWNPARWYEMLSNVDFEMGFDSVPQRNLYNSDKTNRVAHLLQSRGLGGCQLHNAMVYVRGGRSTYDHWAHQLGCGGWDYRSLVPHFEEIEETLGIVTAEQDAFSQSFLDAFQRLGLPHNEDYNGGSSEYGAVPFQFAIEKAADGRLRRTTSFDKFVGAADLPTLTVATGIYVRRFFADGGARGIEYNSPAGEGMRAYAEREVILSAGAIVSPAILLRSGIGDADAIRDCHLDLLQHLPAVGRNFHDDLGCGFPVLVNAPLPETPYGFVGAGAFACEGGRPPSDPPAFGEVNLEVQISTSALPGAPGAWGLRYCLIGCSAMHLNSRGTVALDPARPFGPPVVDPAWLTAEGDLDRCLAAMGLAYEVAADPQLTRQWQWLAPPKAFVGEDWVRLSGTTVQHYVGSCQMGGSATDSVVGPDLRVHGVEGLRVIDASVAPTTVTGNTAGVAMVIGAKGAELLLRDG
ncbi:MAG: choline dehydrogenase [Sphingomonadales bacterium]|nr:choline dehydrogenase [Sphingomonadales bacterium]